MIEDQTYKNFKADEVTFAPENYTYEEPTDLETAQEMREILKNFYNTVGSVDWQDESIGQGR